MTERMSELYEEGDIRRDAADILETISERALNEEEAEKAAKIYLELIDCCFAKFNALLEEKNMFAALAIPFLTTKLALADADHGLRTTNEHWNGFMDLMLTIYLLRAMEKAGNASPPFAVTLEKGEPDGNVD